MNEVAEQSEILEQLFATEYTGMVRLAYTLVGSDAEADGYVITGIGSSVATQAPTDDDPDRSTSQGTMTVIAELIDG